MGHDGAGCDTLPAGATSIQDETWIPSKSTCLFSPSPEGARLSGLAKLPGPRAATGHPVLLHRPAESAGKRDNSGKETTGIAQGEVLVGRLPGERREEHPGRSWSGIDSCSTSAAFGACSL